MAIEPTSPPPTNAPPVAAIPAAPPNEGDGTGPVEIAPDPNQQPHSSREIPLSFWQQPWVQNVLPFVTSVTVHATLILLGVVFFVGAKYVAQKIAHQEETIIPDAQMVDQGPPGGVPHQGLGDPTRQAFQDTERDAGTPEGFASKQSPNRDLQAEGGGDGNVDDTLLTRGPGGGFRGKGNNGVGDGENGGPLALFGTPGGGGIGPKGPLFGSGGNALRIAFVCDASGSMLNKFSTLKRELSKTVEGLKPVQSFDLIFFQEQDATALNRDGLIMATPENKLKAETYLDEKVTPKGETNPIPAIDLAFKQKPQLVYLLTDGDFPDNEAVVKKIRELEKVSRIKINTIAFVGEADKDTAFMEVLKKIAQETGGVYKFVRENEL